jgi:hypothetical protein
MKVLVPVLKTEMPEALCGVRPRRGDLFIGIRTMCLSVTWTTNSLIGHTPTHPQTRPRGGTH